MAKTLGTLTVLIGASTALFQRELERASQATDKWAKSARTSIGGALAKIDDQLSQFSDQVDRAFSDPLSTINNFVSRIKIIGPAIKAATVTVGAFAASFGLVVTAGVAAGRMFQELSEDIQQTVDTADRLGVSFEFLRGLENFAASFGINAGQVNDNLRQMTTNLGNAQQALAAGTTSSSGFTGQVEAMGLSVEALFRADPEERFTTLVDAIADLPTETERAVAAVLIFGESGRDLVSIAEDGSESLGKMIDRFADLGAQLSEQEIQRISDARQALFELGLVVEGLTQQFLASFAPIFTTLAEFVTQSGFTAETVSELMDMMAGGVARAIAFVDQIVVAGFRTWFAFRATVNFVLSGILQTVSGFQRAIEATMAGVSGTLASAAQGIANFIARVVNNALDGLNQVIAAANNIPGVNVPAIQARISAPNFGGGFSVNLGSRATNALAEGLRGNAQDLLGVAGDTRSTFFEDFQRNRNVVPVPAPPPRGIGTLPPPPPSGGGGSGGGRSGGAGRSSSTAIDKDLKDKTRAIRDLEKALADARKKAAELGASLSGDLQDTLESNEAERFRLELLEQGAMRIDEQVRRFEELREVRDEFAQSEQELENLLTQGLITQDQFAESLGQITEEFQKLEEAFSESDALSQAQDRVQAINDLTEGLNERLQEELGLNERLTEVERLRLEIKQLDVELTDKQIAGLEKLASVVDLTAERTRRLEEQYSLLEDTSNILIQSGSNLFQSLIRETGSLNDRLGQFFNNLFDNLLQLSINTIFQSLLGGGGGGGFLGGLLGFQSGGVVPETGPYLLHSGERVFNRSEVGRMRQEGGKVVVNNYSRSTVDTQVNSSGDREIIIRDAVRQSRQAVANDFTRSVASGYGTYSDGIQGSYIVRRKI